MWVFIVYHDKFITVCDCTFKYTLPSDALLQQKITVSDLCWIISSSVLMADELKTSNKLEVDSFIIHYD